MDDEDPIVEGAIGVTYFAMMCAAEFFCVMFFVFGGPIGVAAAILINVLIILNHVKEGDI